MNALLARAVRKFAAMLFGPAAADAPPPSSLKPQASPLAPRPANRGPRICASLQVAPDCTLAVVFHACQLDEALVECCHLALVHRAGDEARRLLCVLATNAAVQVARAMPEIAPPPGWVPEKSC